MLDGTHGILPQPHQAGSDPQTLLPGLTAGLTAGLEAWSWHLPCIIIVSQVYEMAIGTWNIPDMHTLPHNLTPEDYNIRYQWGVASSITTPGFFKFHFSCSYMDWDYVSAWKCLGTLYNKTFSISYSLCLNITGVPMHSTGILNSHSHNSLWAWRLLCFTIGCLSGKCIEYDRRFLVHFPH